MVFEVKSHIPVSLGGSRKKERLLYTKIPNIIATFVANQY